MDDMVLQDLARQAGTALSQQELMLATAESCTGGWLGQTITSIAGSSAWYERGFITYAAISKHEMLGVSNATLEQYGAVSEQTASEMSAGAIARSHAQVAVSITGIAGPDGATPEKPVGMVCFAWIMKEGMALAETRYFSGSREEIRRQSVAGALQGVIDLLYSIPPKVA
ncbi:CinA family protein [Nitrosospira briensis]|uniref:CinA family protein n=1 Tax=Nitrosospira briensis TaxID=35799 RepID=UPI0008EB1D58|nr:nicotinamide-nucleotide amidohydrolase family protein [Nitrosospira briensis]SFO27856.1 nicotinamide-nucleotide amidase [Nitrosospira briensis]